jgi:SAM-dependent methyltransferase
MLALVREAGGETAPDRAATLLQPVHDRIVERLAPKSGERILDGYDGDWEYLTFDDGAFDAAASAFGFVWARDHANVAAELARVLRPAGRLGFTAWKPNPKLSALYRSFTEEPLEGRESTEWGREDHVEDMLGDDFELEFEDGTLWLEVESGEEVWQLFSTSSPPLISLLRRLDDARGEEFHHAYVELFETYRDGDLVRVPRRYLLSLGRRLPL